MLEIKRNLKPLFELKPKHFFLLNSSPGAVDVVLGVVPGPAPHLDVVQRQAEDLAVPALLDPVGPRLPDGLQDSGLHPGVQK